MFRQWLFRPNVETPAQAFRSLQIVLSEWRQRLSFGPIPGQILGLSLSTTGTAPIATTFQVVPPFPECRLIAVSHRCIGGTMTIDILDDAGTMLQASLSSSSTAAMVKGRSAILNKQLRGTITLEVESVDSGSPTELQVVVWLQQMAAIDLS